MDVLATDAEIPADTGYGDRIRRAGFGLIPEIQPSRHRISLPLPPDATDDDIRAGFGKSTRQRINGAERAGLRVARYDTAGWTDDAGLFVPPARRSARPCTASIRCSNRPVAGAASGSARVVPSCRGGSWPTIVACSRTSK